MKKSEKAFLKEGEKLEPLGKSYSIIVNREHTFGTDAVLLASFADAKSGEKVCDLGSGCGIIPLLWHKAGCKDITAVEIQTEACSLLARTAEINSLHSEIRVVNADLRQLKGVIPTGCFDKVCMNPPYMEVGRGIASESDSDRIARHETMCSLSDVAVAASGLLRYSGRLYLCQRPDRLTDVLCCLREHRLEPKKLRFVVQSEGKEPWLFLVEGRLGGKPGLTILPELTIKAKDGSNSDELRRIFGDYMDGHQ